MRRHDGTRATGTGEERNTGVVRRAVEEIWNGGDDALLHPTLFVRAGETVNIPANAPHEFHNKAQQPAPLLGMCAPSGQDVRRFRWGLLRSVKDLRNGPCRSPNTGPHERFWSG